jgi:hypothetical protein
MSEVVEPGRIRIAEPNPPRCSSCFAAKPTEPHVDFGAYYDGPVLPASPDQETQGVTLHAIDDLIICSECLRAAAKLVGMSDAAQLEAELVELTAKLDKTTARNVELEGHVIRLEDTLASTFRTEANRAAGPLPVVNRPGSPAPKPKPKPRGGRRGAKARAKARA